MKRFILFAALTSAGVAVAQEEFRIRVHVVNGASPPAIGLRSEKTPLLHSTVHGWVLTGSNPKAYEVRCDQQYTDCGMPIFRSRAGASEPYGMGSMTHSEPADLWRGQKVRLSAELRVGRVDGWAGVWVRVDGADGQPLAFDNMQNRPLRGTSGFQRAEVVVAVPENAERISFGVLLHGPGAVWVREIDFGVAPGTAVSTDLLAPLRQSRPESRTVEAAPPEAQPSDVAKN